LPVRPPRISRVLLIHGYPVRTFSEANKLAHESRKITKPWSKRVVVNWTSALVEKCRYLYWDCERGAKDISKIVGLKPHAIIAGLKRNGVELRSRSDAQKVAHKNHPDSFSRESSPAWKGGRKINKAGYVLVLLEESDPYFSVAQRNGYALEHRYVMSKAIGRVLDRKEPVHHINGIRHDNRPENLKLVSRRDHDTLTKLCFSCPLRSDLNVIMGRVTLLEAENTLLKKQLNLSDVELEVRG